MAKFIKGDIYSIVYIGKTTNQLLFFFYIDITTFY